MRRLLDTPLIVWLAAAFAGGIVVAGHWRVDPALQGLFVAAAVSAWAAARWCRSPGWHVVGAVIVAVVLGLVRASFDAAAQPRWPEALDGRSVTATGTVVQPPEATLRGWRAAVRVQSLSAISESPASRRSRARRSARARLPPEPAVRPQAEQPPSVRGLVRVTGRGDPPSMTAGSRVTVRGLFRAGRPAGNPGERSERDALRRRGLAGVIAVRPDAGMAVERSGGWSLRGVAAGVRRRMMRTTLASLPEPHGGLLLSLLLGIDSHLDPGVYQQFSRAGLVHLMVVSGAQVAIVAGVCAWAARTLRLSVSVATVATGLGVGVFAGLIDWAPSIGRAVLMTAIALGGVLLGRPRDRGATLAGAALALLLANPRALYDIGFQLSFAATWGLLFLAPVLEGRLGFLGPRVSSALAVTLGAQAAVAPLLAVHFQSLPLAGLLANVLVLPVIAVLVPAGFALIPAVVLLPPVGAMLLNALRPALALILWLGARFGGLSWATVPIPPMPGWTGGLVFGLLGALVAMSTRAWPASRAQRTATAAFAVLVLGLWYVHAGQPPTALAVTVIDVAQGDAIAIQSPGGRTVLIDGGGEIGAERSGWDIGRMRVVPALRRAGIRRLDVVLLSHPHEDHVGGLPAVLENFPVGLVLDPGVSHPSPSYIRLLRLVEAGRIPYRTARAGMILDLAAGVALTILHPPEAIPAVDGDPAHSGMVVGRLTYGQTAMMLTGDAEAPVEHSLIGTGVPLVSEVLKVGHHGSRTSTTPEWLRAVRPRYAVISLGADNDFGHPHAVTLAALEAAGATVYRTDLDGAVRLTSDGSVWRIATARTRSHARVH